MYGQVGKKSYEVKLVRVSPWDNRVSGADKTQSIRKAVNGVLAFLLTMILIVSACLGLVYFCFMPEAEENVVVPETEILSSGADATVMEFTEPEIVATAEAEPKIPLVVIDPGHGGEDEGCVRENVLEKEINLELAKRLAERLQDLGFEVMLTREDNETALTLEQRVRLAETAAADLYVSIHINAETEGDTKAAGIETWYCGELGEAWQEYDSEYDAGYEGVFGERDGQVSKDSRRLARLVHEGILCETGARNREVRESNWLYVLRETSMPSCLVEAGFLSNKEERALLCNSDYQEKLAEGIAEGVYNYFNPKTMYLTFDDGPSRENTVAVLDILKEHDIKATFFVVGENVRRYPEIAQRIVEEGHTIGIHCNKHEYNEIYASVDSYLADFQEAYDAVYEATGVEVKLFRFPGGSINAYNRDVYQDIIEEMTERGFVYFDWNGSLEDAVSKSTPEQLVQNAKDSTLGRKKVVMLAHDIVYNTVLCLEDLIDSFPEYRFEPLTEEVKPIQF